MSLIFSFISGLFWETTVYMNYRMPIEVWQIAAIRGIPYGFFEAALMRPAMIFVLRLQIHILDGKNLSWNSYFRNDQQFLELMKIILVSAFLVPLTELCLALVIHPSLNSLSSIQVSYLVCLPVIFGVILGIVFPSILLFKFLGELRSAN